MKECKPLVVGEAQQAAESGDASGAAQFHAGARFSDILAAESVGPAVVAGKGLRGRRRIAAGPSSGRGMD